MKRHILSASMPGALALLVAFGTPVAAQNLPATDEAPTVLPMSEAGEVLRMTVGHSKLLQADEAFGTIIVGDDSIANATVGAGNSIIVTGLQAGSTNLIVLGESERMLLSATVAVVPVAGALRSTVTVLRGAETRDRYECRGSDCLLVEADSAQTEMSFLLTPAASAAEAPAEDAEPAQ